MNVKRFSVCVYSKTHFTIVLNHSSWKTTNIYACNKMYWTDKHVNVINTLKNNNCTTFDNNVRVGQSDVGYKNQTFSFIEHTKNHSSSMTNHINSLCDHPLPQYMRKLQRIDVSRLMRSRVIRSHSFWRTRISYWLAGGCGCRTRRSVISYRSYFEDMSGVHSFKEVLYDSGWIGVWRCHACCYSLV